MSNFSEIFQLVWHEFQHIIEIIRIQCKETSLLSSISESSTIFIDNHKGLINQAKETVWRAYNNEKKLKKFYYKTEVLIRPIDKSFVKVSLNYFSCINLCNNIHTALEEYLEIQVPKFISKVKETGNHFKIQVSKLEWREDESAEDKVENVQKKQPKIFFSNNILAVMCQVAPQGNCVHQKKNACLNNLGHFREVFELTASVFANMKNLSRILLYIKLCLEKFKLVLSDLQNLAQTKLSYYKSFSQEIKVKVTNDRLYRIIARLLKIQEFLIEHLEKLESFSMISGQVQYCSSTCISISLPLNYEKLNFTVTLPKIMSQISFIIKFISSLLNHSVVQKIGSQKIPTFIQERSFLFTIFHLRSIMLTKLQPYTLSINLKRFSSLLYSYLFEHSSGLKLNLPRSFKVINGQKHVRASISSSKHIVHSYNSSWDLQENPDVEETSEFDEELEYSKFRRSPKKLTHKVSITPDISPSVSVSTRYGHKSAGEYQSSNDPKSATLPSLQSTSAIKRAPTPGFSEVDNQDYGFSEKMKRLRNANAGFLTHRIQRIQNNRSISPLTKIEYIREEFANNFKPVDLKLKNSLKKMKDRSTFLYTMK